MRELFEWQTLVFALPLGFGVLLVLGSAFGLVESDLELDIEAEADVEAEADIEAEAATDAQSVHVSHATQLLELFGIGKVPMAILITCFSLLFGGIGLAAKFLFSAWPTLTMPIALGLAISSAFGLTSAIGKAVARWLPSTETYATKRHQLVGSLGVAELPIHKSFGLANITADDGSLLKVRCISETQIAKGEPILITDFDPATNQYLVELSPLAEVMNEIPKTSPLQKETI